MNKNILVIDDDSNMISIYKEMFKNSKYDVTYETDTNHALKVVSENTPALIVLDIIMDPMPGDSFFMWLRNNEKTAKIPVIAVTVLEPEVLRNLTRFDYLQVLQKPIKEVTLLKQIEKMLFKMKRQKMAEIIK